MKKAIIITLVILNIVQFFFIYDIYEKYGQTVRRELEILETQRQLVASMIRHIEYHMAVSPGVTAAQPKPSVIFNPNFKELK